MRPVVGGSRQGHRWLGRERPRRLVHVRRGCRGALPAQTRPGSDLPGASGGGGRLRVLRSSPARDDFQRSQLLRGVRQRRRDDERRRHLDVLLPDTEARREETKNHASRRR